MVNYYDEDPRLLLDYRLFFKSKQTKFVLCDFGLSVMFPPDTPPSARVCPAEESTWGTFEYHPPDVANGEAVYDPFAYDVACMGGVLCHVIGVRYSVILLRGHQFIHFFKSVVYDASCSTSCALPGWHDYTGYF